MNSRFDYVAYDKEATEHQKTLKIAFTNIENLLQAVLKPGRYTSLAITKLEECYTWAGKQLRDDQIARNGSAELQEGRNDG